MNKKTVQDIQNAKIIKWSQWGMTGMMRCGKSEYKKIMEWVRRFGAEAKQDIKLQEKNHAVYARVMHDDCGIIKEIRLYSEVYFDDAELEAVTFANPMDTIYAVHK